MVLVNTKFRIMEILIMNSAGEFNSAIFATKRFCNVYNWHRCRGKYSVWEAVWTTVKIFSSPVQSTGRAIVVTLASALPLPLPLPFPSCHF